jgi:hypothetical protein
MAPPFLTAAWADTIVITAVEKERTGGHRENRI